MGGPSRTRALLAAARPLSESVRQLDLLPASPLSFQAGQWLNLSLSAGDETITRPYSIANAPREDGVVQLAVTQVPGGIVSPLLHELAVGCQVEVDGGHGFFVREGDAQLRPALFVAAGTGLAPLRAMLQALPDPRHPPVALLFGCRTCDDILWADEMSAWRRAGVGVSVSLSRPDAQWSGLRGYVQGHVVALARSLGEPDVYVCGLSRMVKAVREELKRGLGYDRRRIHSERYD